MVYVVLEGSWVGVWEVDWFCVVGRVVEVSGEYG